MILFAFDVYFKNGRLVTLFFHDFDVTSALLRAPVMAREQYGRDADDIVSISTCNRYN